MKMKEGMVMKKSLSAEELRKLAYENRRLMLDVMFHVKSGHQGGSLSLMDIMTALYFSLMNIDSDRPDWADRDRLVLSKGHASAGYYTVLAQRGFFPKEELFTYSRINSRLQGHPDMLKTPGVDFTSGSLGQGFSAAIGIALGAKKVKQPFLTYVILGDGELDEGQVWEGIMFAANYKLDNLIVIVDKNGFQCAGSCEDIMSNEHLDEKFESFNWHVLKMNGNRMEDILETIKGAQKPVGKPTVIIAETLKGKGVKFMENRFEWHSQVFTEETYNRAINELYMEV